MTPTIIESGVVQAVSQRTDNYGVLVNDKWHNGPGQCVAVKGDFVDIEYTTNAKGSRSVSSLVVRLDKKSEPKAPESDMHRSKEEMRRSIALQAAVVLVAALPEPNASVAVDAAEYFEQWLATGSRSSE